LRRMRSGKEIRGYPPETAEIGRASGVEIGFESPHL
jgi:hypothetical protein